MAFGIDANQKLNPAGLMAVGSRQENEIAAAAYVSETGRGWVESLDIVRAAFTEADKYMEQKANLTPPIADVLPLLQSLAVGLKLAILSSDTVDNVQEFTRHYGIESYFVAQVGVDGYLNKTDPILLRQVLLQLGVAPAQVLVIGDSRVDIEIARSIKAGGCIGFVGGWSTPLDLSGADVIISSFSEIQVI